MENENETERLAKFMARAGVASRRASEALIEAGRVTVNGELVKTPAFTVSARDIVALDGKRLSKPPLRVWIYHKPIGLVTTRSDEKGRRTIYDALPKALANISTIGRLDLNSEGLLLLTNDGALKRQLELPSTGWRRKYRVRAYGKADEAKLERLRAGIEVEGERFLPMEILHERDQGDNAWYIVGLREGKNREIRRAFEAIDLQVNRLIRVSYGPFQLGHLPKGAVVEQRARALTTLLGGLIPEGSELANAPLDLSDEETKPAGKPNANRQGKPARSGATPSKRDGHRPRGKSEANRAPSRGAQAGKGGEWRGKARSSESSAERNPRGQAKRSTDGRRSDGAARSSKPATRSAATRGSSAPKPASRGRK